MSNQQCAGGGRPLGALLAGLAHLVYHRLIDPMRRHACSRAGERELARLDDRLLRDIGLTRSQVHAAAYGLVRLGKHAPADSMRPSPSGPSKGKRRVVALRVHRAPAAPLAKGAARG